VIFYGTNSKEMRGSPRLVPEELRRSSKTQSTPDHDPDATILGGGVEGEYTLRKSFPITKKNHCECSRAGDKSGRVWPQDTPIMSAFLRAKSGVLFERTSALGQGNPHGQGLKSKKKY